MKNRSFQEHVYNKKISSLTFSCARIYDFTVSKALIVSRTPAEGNFSVQSSSPISSSNTSQSISAPLFIV
jgi:hypothetical protein